MRRLNELSGGRLLAHAAAAAAVYVLCSLIVGLCYGFFLGSGAGGALEGARASELVGGLFRSPWIVVVSILFMLGLIDFQNRRALG